MKAPLKISLIIFALALLGGLVAFMLRSQPDEPLAESVSDTPGSPAFAVRVVMPRLGLPFGGILPDRLVAKFDGTPSELRFDNASRGARIGTVGHDRIELSADGWDLSIAIDGEGHITSGTRLVFNLPLGGKQVKLRCRPADPSIGNLHTSTRLGSGELGGRFIVELATCENAESGKAINWPPAPLTMRGSFAGLPPGSR